MFNKQTECKIRALFIDPWGGYKDVFSQGYDTDMPNVSIDEVCSQQDQDIKFSNVLNIYLGHKYYDDTVWKGF